MRPKVLARTFRAYKVIPAHLQNLPPLLDPAAEAQRQASIAHTKELMAGSFR